MIGKPHRMVSGAGNIIVLPRPLRPRVAVVLLHITKEKQKRKVPGGQRKKMPGIPAATLSDRFPAFLDTGCPFIFIYIIKNKFQ